MRTAHDHPSVEEFADIEAAPGSQVRSGRPKLRILEMAERSYRRPYALLNGAALEHFRAHEFGWVKVQRSTLDPRWVRILGCGTAVPGALRIRKDRRVSGAVIRRLAPPGTDIFFDTRGPDLVGRIPDGVPDAWFAEMAGPHDASTG